MEEQIVEHRLSGVIEKYNRSSKQYDELLSEMDTFFNADPGPHFSKGEFDSEAWEWVERVQVREEPPIRFGVILGDVLHNLRSALDHLMWQVTLLDGGKPDRQTQFPIVRESEAKFEKVAQRQIPGLSVAHRELVKQVQPFHAGERAEAHPLAVLATLSNTDKHQIVNPTISFVANETKSAADRLLKDIKDDPNSPAHGVLVVAHGQRMEHGTPWFRIGWKRDQAPPTEVRLAGELTLGIAFGEIGVDAEEFKRIGEVVLMIIQRFQADFPETQFTDE
jgi:hypothetical protein